MSHDPVGGLVLSTLTPDALYRSLGERALKEESVFFAVFYGSDNNGNDGASNNASSCPPGMFSWCGDCRSVSGLINNIFNKSWPVAVPVINVGSRPEWRDPNNVWRQYPFNIALLPTLIRIEAYVDPLDASKRGYCYRKLVEHDIEEAKNLQLFIDGSLLKTYADEKHAIVVDGKPYSQAIPTQTQA